MHLQFAQDALPQKVFISPAPTLSIVTMLSNYLILLLILCTLTLAESRRRNSKIFELPGGIPKDEENETHGEEVSNDRRGKRKETFF